ncbi:MAG: PAS domain-containing sensor histidine kinase [Thermoplasmatota archaeon]
MAAPREPDVGGSERDMLAALVTSSSDAMWAKKLDGTVMLWNPAAERLLGYTPKEILGQSVQRLVPEALWTHEQEAMARIARGERLEPFETQRVCKDGRIVNVSVSLSPIHDAQGRVMGASQVARDLSPERQQLLSTAEAASAEVAQLKEQSTFRARFINIAAHELKTPLTPLRLQVQILRLHLKDAPPQILESLEILERATLRLNSIVEDVLDAARIQASQMRIRKEPVDVAAIAEEAAKSYLDVAREVGVELSIESKGPAVVLGDDTRLLQVANNLLSNALKFTPTGGHIELAVRADAQWVTLAVTDSGRGLTRAKMAQLFQPFTQVHADQEATRRGTGLGLFIVRAIVEQHGGKVAIDSPGPGKGTTLTVDLPNAHLPAPRPKPTVSNLGQRKAKARLRDLV